MNTLPKQVRSTFKALLVHNHCLENDFDADSIEALRFEAFVSCMNDSELVLNMADSDVTVPRELMAYYSDMLDSSFQR